MRKLEATAVVDKDGRLSVELPTNLSPGQHRLTLLVEEEPLGAPPDAGPTRQKFHAFVEGWDAPEMSEYDNL